MCAATGRCATSKTICEKCYSKDMILVPGNFVDAKAKEALSLSTCMLSSVQLKTEEKLI